MLEILGSIAGAVFGQGARFSLEQLFGKPVRFGVETSTFDKARYSFKGRPVYQVDLRVIVTGHYNIRVVELVDGSGDGLVFFPNETKSDRGQFLILYHGPKMDAPQHGSISADELHESQQGFTTYVATERAQEWIYIDVRYTVLNERQSEKRSLIRFRAVDNC